MPAFLRPQLRFVIERQTRKISVIFTHRSRLDQMVKQLQYINHIKSLHIFFLRLYGYKGTRKTLHFRFKFLNFSSERVKYDGPAYFDQGQNNLGTLNTNEFHSFSFECIYVNRTVIQACYAKFKHVIIFSLKFFTIRSTFSTFLGLSLPNIKQELRN